MAIATQIIIDGPRNVVAKTTGDVTAAFAGTTILDPAAVTSMNPGMPGSFGPTLFDVRQIDYSISDGIAVQLFWDATTPVAICELTGRGNICMKDYGGWHNNAGAGITGKITMSVIATGSAFPTVATLTVLLECVKFRPLSAGGA